jgi:hypothetical protein
MVNLLIRPYRTVGRSVRTIFGENNYPAPVSTDRSCIRLWPQYPGDIWAYDFVEGAPMMGVRTQQPELPPTGTRSSDTGDDDALTNDPDHPVWGLLMSVAI